MSPNDAGRVTDTAASLAQLATSLTKRAKPARPLPAMPLPDEDGLSRLQESPPRKADIRLFNDPSNFLG